MTYESYMRGDDGTWVFTLSVSMTSKFDSWKVNMTSMTCYSGDIYGTSEYNSRSVDGRSFSRGVTTTHQVCLLGY